jgi:periplasmic divalent cation tolerance protein
MGCEYLQVLTTAGSRAEAGAIAAALIERRLAACVQISGPITSIYRWQGAIENAEEWHCLAKTASSHWDAVEAAIRELHSYEQPEIVATPIAAGSAGYLRWIDESLGD